MTFTPERTSKDAMLHHSPQEQIINNSLLEEGEKSYVFRQLRSVRSKLFYHSISTLCLLCNLLHPDARNPNYTLALAHAQSVFSSLTYSLFPSLFFCPWPFTTLYFSRKRFSQNSPEVQEVHFKAFSDLVKQEFHWNIF